MDKWLQSHTTKRALSALQARWSIHLTWTSVCLQMCSETDSMKTRPRRDDDDGTDVVCFGLASSWWSNMQSCGNGEKNEEILAQKQEEEYGTREWECSSPNGVWDMLSKRSSLQNNRNRAVLSLSLTHFPYRFQNIWIQWFSPPKPTSYWWRISPPKRLYSSVFSPGG